MVAAVASAAEVIRNARVQAGLSQRELAGKLATTQSAVARLEAHGSNPRVQTVERALHATGHRLVLAAAPAAP